MNPYSKTPEFDGIKTRAGLLKALYEEGEIDEEATCKDYLQVRHEGSRQVKRSVKHYKFSDHDLLTHAGKITAEQAKEKAELEYDRYHKVIDLQPTQVDRDLEAVIGKLSKENRQT